MTEPVFGLEIAHAEQFATYMSDLRKRGAISEFGNDQFEAEYGPDVAEDVPKMKPQVQPTAELVAGLIGLVPGVEITQTTRLNLINRENLLGSSYSVQAHLLREGDNNVGVNINFPRYADDTSSLEFFRVSNGQRVGVTLMFTPDSTLRNGWISIGEVDKTNHAASINRGTAHFDHTGVITRMERGIDSQLHGVNNVRIPTLLHEVTTAKDLGQPINLRQMMQPAA